MPTRTLKPQVALDLDGVIVACVEGCLSLFLADCGPDVVTGWDGIPDAITTHQPQAIRRVEAVDWSTRWGMSADDVADVTGQRHLFPGRWPSAERHTITSKQLWEAVAAMGDRFWAQLDPLPWARPLIAALETCVGAENIMLVTAPQANPESWSGKMRWIRTHMPEYASRTHMCKTKTALAKPNVLLIDDGAHNVGSWRAEGAPAVLWPMPWNTAGETAYDAPFTAVSIVEDTLAELADKLSA